MQKIPGRGFLSTDSTPPERVAGDCEDYSDLRRLAATGDETLGGKKELTGRTHLDGETSNQCARLIANAIVFYNSAILSRPLTRYAATGNEAALALITSTSPVATTRSAVVSPSIWMPSSEGSTCVDGKKSCLGVPPKVRNN